MIEVPEDFDQFWAEAAAEASQVPLDYHRSLTQDFDYDGFRIETIRFRSVQEKVVEGWIAYPPEARRNPGFLWIPPYGRESLLPNRYGTREGMVSLSLNLLGENAFHQEKYTPSRGYFAQGAESPETWIFRTMIQHCLIALRVLQAQSEADENRLGAMGMSQGAGLAIACGAHSDIVKAICADMPFLGNMPQVLSRNAYRYPLKELIDFTEVTPLGRERLMHTLSYFDTMHQATRCQVPAQISLGLKDPACRPESVQAIFEALPVEKSLITYDWGHDWHPDMVSNNRDWLNEHFASVRA